MRIVVKYKNIPTDYNNTIILSESFAIVDSTIEQIRSDKNIIGFELPFKTFPMVENGKAASCIPASERIGNLSGKGVLVGIVDSGITPNHREFGNRIINIWDIPNDRIYTREEIEDGIDIVDNENHGTAVTAIAAGESGVAPEADIVVVAIGGGMSDDIMKAVSYIRDRAVDMNMPFVVNISYGTNFGGHNGQTLLEQFIDEISLNNVCSIVIATGNEGNKAHHYKGIGNSTVEFNVGSSLRNIRLELWMNYIDDISLSITSPDGSTTSVLSGNSFEYRQILTSTEVRVSYIEPTNNTVDRKIEINLIGSDFVEIGLWQIDIITTGEFNIWLPSEESVRFLNPDIYTTLTIPSTAYRAISVGGYNSNLQLYAPFSGRGDTREIVYSKPDIVAPAVDIRTASATGGYGNFTGTSFAAPFVSGVCALLLEWGIVQGNDNGMYGDKIKAYLRRYAARSDNLTYPNREWGYGRLCFREVYDNLIPVNREVNSMSINNIALSEDYVDLIVDSYDQGAGNSPAEAEFVCKTKLSKYNIIYISIDRYQNLIMNPVVGSGIRSATPLLLSHTDNDITQPENISNLINLPNDYRGGGVLVGIIDDGIDINDEAFKYENGESRIYSIWVQDDDKTSEGVCFGREYTRDEITKGNININNGRYGTAMAKAAQRIAPDVEFVVVKLKGAKQFYRNALGIDADAVAYESSDIILGIDYVINVSQISRMPISIILGLGTNKSGHDNQNIFEIYLSTIAINNGISIVTAVGNEALRDRHTNTQLNNDSGFSDIEIEVREGGGSFTLCAWNDIVDRVDVSIIPPIGNPIGRIVAVNNFVNTYRLSLTNTTIRLEYRIPLYRTGSQLSMLTFNNATEGIWRIRFYGTTSLGKVDCWLPIYEFAKNVRFLSPVVSTTLTVPSTAATVISVGGYNPDTNTAINSSGRGPTRGGALKPQLVAPTVSSTAISAAFAAGVAAILLEWGIVRGNNLNINTINILSFMLQGAVPLNTPSVVPNNIWGYGSINLYNIFDKL